MMGRRESHEATMVHSSIALLQERFRELQRMKEMREERQILQIRTQPSQFYSDFPNNTPEFIIPSGSRSPPPQVSLTLWPESQGTQDHNRRGLQTPVISTNTSNSNYSIHTHSLEASGKKLCDCDSEYSDSGVDTSLHL